MGCGGSGEKSKISMQKTGLPAMDELFDDVQGFVDEIYELMDPIDDARAKLLEETEFDKISCGNTHHATVGIIFAMAATMSGSVDVAFKIKAEMPFIELDKSKGTGKVVSCIEAFQEYVKAISAAKDRIEPLAMKSKEFAEKAPDLPNKAKDEVKNAQGLGPFQAIAAVKNTASNCKHMASLPTLVNDLRKLVTDCITELQSIVKELNNKKTKLADIGKTCQSKKLVLPKECYLECGDKIDSSAEKKKEWDKNKGKGKKKGNKKDTKGKKK